MTLSHEPKKRLVTRRFRFNPDSPLATTVHEEIIITTRPPKPKGRHGFTMVWLDELLTLPPMPWTAMRCLGALAKFHNKTTGTIRYKLSELQEITLDPHTQQVSRSIQVLIEAGVIIRISRGEVMLNPDFAWIGDEASQDRARARMYELLDGGQNRTAAP